MSKVLNDSPTAVKIHDRILAELQPGERVLFASDGQVIRYWGDTPGNLYGALVVTDRRFFLAEPKSFGRAAFTSLPWGEVLKFGPHKIAGHGLAASTRPNVWRLLIEAPGKKSGNGWRLDEERMTLLKLSILEALDAVRKDQALERETKDAAAAAAYEELRRRRGE